VLVASLLLLLLLLLLPQLLLWHAPLRALLEMLLAAVVVAVVLLDALCSKAVVSVARGNRLEAVNAVEDWPNQRWHPIRNRSLKHYLPPGSQLGQLPLWQMWPHHLHSVDGKWAEQLSIKKDHINEVFPKLDNC